MSDGIVACGLSKDSELTTVTKKIWRTPGISMLSIDETEANPPPGNIDVHPPNGTFHLS